MIPNVKPSVIYPLAGNIAPQSVAAAASVSTGWVDALNNKWASLSVLIGAGAGTAAVKLEQATSSGGAGVKDLLTAAQLGITAQGTGQAQADGDLPDNLDIAGGFRWIRATLTMTGGAGTLAAVTMDIGPAAWEA